MAVEVVRGEVDEDRALGREVLGVLELEAGGLADHGRVGVDRAGQRGERCADVAGDGDRAAGGPVEVADQLGRGGLAVGARDGAEGVRDQPPGELELAGDLDAALARRPRRRARPGARRGSSPRVRARSSCRVPSTPKLTSTPERLQPCRLLRRARIDPEHGLATLGEDARDGRAGARQTRPPGRALQAGEDAASRLSSHNHVRPRPLTPCVPGRAWSEARSAAWW